MRRWTLLDTAETHEGDRLELHQRGEEFSIRVHGAELMNSRAHASEEAMARLAVDALAAKPPRHVLIGGLGMGFTLAATLAALSPTDQVTVAELVPGVAAWNGGPLGPLAGRPLEDPRTTLFIGDVGGLLRRGSGTYEAVLLDVDNGPEGLTRAGNDALYGPAGLAACHRALKPGGVLAVWSAAPSEVFTHGLRRAGFRAEAHTVRGHPGGKGPRHTVWVAVR